MPSMLSGPAGLSGLKLHYSFTRYWSHCSCAPPERQQPAAAADAGSEGPLAPAAYEDLVDEMAAEGGHSACIAVGPCLRMR